MPPHEETILKHLALHGNSKDRMDELRILLDLGADSTHRDHRRWLPSSCLKDAKEKPLWIELERGVMARRAATDALALIEFEVLNSRLVKP